MSRARFLILTAVAAIAWGLADAKPADPMADPEFKGFVSVAPGRELHVEWTKAAPGSPTVVLLNGLTYSTRQWDRFAAALASSGTGVLRYDMRGMGQTLLREAPLMEKVPIENQVLDLRELLLKLGFKEPVSLAGLSYGGGLALAFAASHPELVRRIILMAPYTEPLPEQDQWIRAQVEATRKANPSTPYGDDEIYDFFLRQIVYLTYPKVEPIVLENPFKLEAVYQLTRGIRHFNAASVMGKLPAGSVHLVIAGSDQYVKRSTLTDFWRDLPVGAKQSLILIQGSEHKIPEAVPRFSAGWVDRILREDPLSTGGSECEGDPFAGIVRCRQGEARLPKEEGV